MWSREIELYPVQIIAFSYVVTEEESQRSKTQLEGSADRTTRSRALEISGLYGWVVRVKMQVGKTVEEGIVAQMKTKLNEKPCVEKPGQSSHAVEELPFDTWAHAFLAW